MQIIFVALKSYVKNRKCKPGAISRRFYSDLTPRHRKGFELARFNNESRRTPRDVLSRSIMEEKKRTKNRSWSYNEEAAVIELWQNFPCLFNTSYVDYKRHDRQESGYIAGVESKA